MSLNIRKDAKTQILERRVQTVADWLSYIGGFWKAMFAIGIALSSLFSYHLFVKTIMKRLYYSEEPKEKIIT